MNDIAIRVQGLKKQYRLGQIGGGTLKADLQSWWARLRHQEDPNTKIGTQQHLSGESLMALNGIDLTVKKGEALGIIGGNGAGKSTLLKILSRITAPTAGSADIYGRITSMLEVGTGFNAEMTGRENIYMNGAILGMTKAEIDAKMEDIIEFSEVREFIDTPVKRYSSGMYVKLAFSVAAHLDSEIMIMDEVLAVGDVAFQQKCLDKMRDAANVQGKTVLYVSHNMNTIRRLCDRCIVMSEGRIVFDGDPEEAIEVYLGSSETVRPVDFDLSQMRDPRLPQKANVKMTHLTLQEKEAAVYKAGEPMILRLTVKANEDIEKLHFQLAIRFDDDTGVGVAFAPCLGSMSAGQEKTFDLKFHTDSLTRGRYQSVMTLYSENEYGKRMTYDSISPAFLFQMEDTASVWNIRNWGHIRFPDIIVTE